MYRGYAGYQAHEQRHGVVHASDDALVALLGPLRLRPGSEASFNLEAPAVLPQVPLVDVRFVAEDRLPTFIEGRRNGTLPYPDDIEQYPTVDLHAERTELDVPLSGERPGRMAGPWRTLPGVSEGATEGRVGWTSILFHAHAEPGIYLFRVSYVDGGGQSRGFSVVVASREPTRFPQDYDDDMGTELHLAVNASDKNGILWFVHPIYFVEQLLGVTLAADVVEDMVTCAGLPEDLPARDPVLIPIQWGWGHRGLRRIWLDVDPLEEPEPCLDLGGVEARPATRITDDFLREASS